MDDIRIKVSEAALEALKIGAENDLHVIEAFRDKAPARVRLPSKLTSGDRKNIRKLIELAAYKVLVIHGDETPGFPSALAVGKAPDVATVGCTGFLVSSDIVLTAAHCMKDGFGGGLWLKDINGKDTFLPPFKGKSKKHNKFGPQ